MTEKKKRLSPLEAIEAQINASKERLEQLKKKRTAVLAVQNQHSRKLENRRKFIIGSIVMEEAKNNPAFARVVETCLKKLTRENDLNAFKDYVLPPTAPNAPTAKE